MISVFWSIRVDFVEAVAYAELCKCNVKIKDIVSAVTYKKYY